MRYNLRFLLLCHFIISECYCKIKLEEKNTNDLDQCVRRLTEAVFSEEDTLFIKSSGSDTYEIPISVANSRLVYSNEDYLEDKTIHFKMGIILMADDFGENIRSGIYSSAFKKYINPNTKWIVMTSNSNISNLFVTMWRYRVIHAVVLVYNETSLRLYTSNPQAIPNNCGKALNLVHEQNCKSQFTIEFPRVLRKYNNCNFQLYTQYVFADEREVAYAKSHFLMSLINSRNITTPYTGPIICRENVIWLVPKPRKMSVLTVIFQKTVWFSIVFCFVITVLVCWLILKLNSVQYGFTIMSLNIWRATFFGSVYKVLPFRILQYLLIGYIIYCVHVQILFTSKLFQSLTVPRYQSNIQNLKDLYESKLPIVVNNRLRDTVFYFQNLRYDHQYDKISKSIRFVREKKFDDVFFDCIEKSECATFFLGHEDYLNASFFNLSHTIKDDSIIGNYHYTFVIKSFSSDYVASTIKKIMYIIFESGITHDFGKVLETNQSKIVFERESAALTFDHFYIACIILAIVLNCNCEIKFVQDDNVELDECVHRVIEALFEEDDSLLFLSFMNPAYHLPNSIKNIRLKLINKKEQVKKPSYFRMGMVIHANHSKTIGLSIVFASMLSYNSNLNTKVLIITPLQSQQDIASFFASFWFKKIMHVVVLVYNPEKNDTSLRLYTGNPQAVSNKCGEAVNSLNEQNCKSIFTLQFPPVIRDYTNCTLEVYTEYAVVEKRQTGYVKSQFYINLIASRLNSNIKFVRKLSSGNYNEIHFNLLRNLRYNHSGPIIYSETAIWAVPKPKQMSTFQVISIIFQKIVWCVILLSFLVTAFTWWLIQKLKSKCVDNEKGFALILLNIWEATLLGLIYKFPSLGALRFLAIVYIIYCIHIQALFTSKMLQSLTVPKYERGIQNLNDLTESKLPIVVSSKLNGTIFSVENVKDDHRYEKIYNSIDFVEEDMFVDIFFDCIKKDRCAAFFVGNEDYLKTDFFDVSHVIKDNSVTGSFDYTFTSKRYSYITATIEKITYMIFESGINNEFGKTLDIEKSKTALEPTAITLDQIYIVFIFLVVVAKCVCEIIFKEENNRELDTCVHRVSEKLFAEEDSVFVVSANDAYVIPNSIKNSRFIYSSNNYVKKGPSFSIKGVILITGDLIDFRSHFILNYYKENSGPNTKWFVVTSNTNLTDFFLTMWTCKIIHVVVLIYQYNKGDSTLRLYTGNPQANPNNCGKSVNLVYEQNCKSEFTLEFPQPLRMYNNCYFSLFTRNFIVNEKDAAITKSQFFINLINSRLNLAEYYTSFAVQVSYLRNLTDTYTGPIICRENVIWVVPKTRKISALKMITSIFEKTIWCSIVILFLIIVLVRWLVTKLKNNYFGGIILTNIWIRGSVLSLRVLRYLLISYVIYCVYLQIAFTSKLFLSLTVPRYEQRDIQNLKDLYESKLFIIVNNKLRHMISRFQNLSYDNHLYKMGHLPIQFVREKLFDDTLFDCIKRGQCATFFVGYEGYHNTTLSKLCRTIKDDLIFGNLHYTLIVKIRYDYTISTIKKMMNIIFESGITDDFGKRLEISQSNNVFEDIPVLRENALLINNNCLLNYLHINRIQIHEARDPFLLVYRKKSEVWYNSSSSVKMVCKFKLLLLLQFLILKSNCIIKFEEDNDELDECVYRVTEALFDEDDSLAFISFDDDNYFLPNNITKSRIRLTSDTSNLLENNSKHFKMGVVFHVNVVTPLALTLISFTNVYVNIKVNTKFLIITSTEDVSRLFSLFWLNKIIHLVVLVHSSSKGNTSLRLYTGNPQEISNNCGQATNVINEQNCKSKFTLKFPPAMRKYTNCSFTFLTEYAIVDKRQAGYSRSVFESRPVALAFDQIYVVFMIFAVGVGLSVLVLVLEVFVKNCFKN
ncbi:hypothetical protein FQR65_LT13268 [Abscondita terminalis]|nr:hypothetical protein FQR65_LT13268 [Abscondita terminalis]